MHIAAAAVHVHEAQLPAGSVQSSWGPGASGRSIALLVSIPPGPEAVQARRAPCKQRLRQASGGRVLSWRRCGAVTARLRAGDNCGVVHAAVAVRRPRRCAGRLPAPHRPLLAVRLHHRHGAVAALWPRLAAAEVCGLDTTARCRTDTERRRPLPSLLCLCVAMWRAPSE